jgi:hypothetical protein
MKFVIPSYKHPKALKQKTLNYLHKCNVSLDDIYIFVADDEQLIEYEKHCGLEYKFIVGVVGKSQVENYIMNFFDNDEQLVHFDDDIDYVYEVVREGEKTAKRKIVYDLYTFCKEAFDVADKVNSKMWGVQIPSNDFWFLNNDKYKYNFFIGGGFFGYYVDKSIMLTSCIDDAERSAQYERKHKNNFTHGRCCFYTKNQWDKGGLSDERTTEVFKEQAEKLCLDYPEFYKGIKETNKKNCPIRLIKKIQRRPKVQF